MKRFLIILFICLPLWSAVADSASTRARIRHIRELVTRQKTELNDTRTRLNQSLVLIRDAQLQIDAIAQQRDQWQAYGNDQHDRYMNAEKRIAEGKAGLLRRDIIIGGLLLAIGTYAVLKFYFHIPFL